MLETAYHHLAFYVISKYPRYCLFGSFLFAALSALSLFHCTVEEDIRKSFSPPQSHASREAATYTRFYNITAPPQRTFILFYAKDGSSMLSTRNMDETLRIHRTICDNIENVDGTGRRACEPLCDINAPFLMFWKELQKAQTNMLGNETSGPDSDSDSESLFGYPISSLFGHEVFVGMNMFGVQTSDKIFANRSTITYVKRVVLWYFAQVNTEQRKQLLSETTVQMFEMSKAKNASPFIQFDVFGDQIANQEMLRGAFEATKLMLIGFFLLLGFVFTVVWMKVKCNHTLPKIVFATISTPFLSAVIAFGLLAWLGFTFYSIMCVTPFLILGIGVDDAFIMLQSWTHFSTIPCKRERLAKVFVEIGPSITITSLTNMIAFGIGYLTPTPQMSMFCLCTSLACLIDYFLTYTLFAAVLYMSDAGSGSRSGQYIGPEKPVKPSDEYGKRGIALYSRFVCSTYGKLSALLILIVLYVLCAIGVANMKSTFEPAKAFPSDSPLSYSLDGIRSVFNEFFALPILINNPPNISNVDEYENFYSMVSSLESIRFSYGRERTFLFLKAYEKFDRKMFDLLNMFGLSGTSSYTPSYDNLRYFLNEMRNPPSVKMAQDQSGSPKLVGFQMTIVAQNMSEWSNRANYVDSCREVFTKYPQFNATLFDGDAAILDLILTVKTDLIGSMAVTVVCMAIVCIFFVSSKLGIAVVTFTISSICFTLVGALSWWGADMDPVTMVDVLIATGFSVDYTAHIAYKYCKASGTREQRIQQSFSEMCAPMIQAGTSTALCMLPLMFVQTYAILAFAKTVFLVVGLGLLHGIFILPVLLVTLTRKVTTVQVCEGPPTSSAHDLITTKEPLVL